MDVGCKLNQAMNGWFTHLVSDAIQPAFVMVGSTLLAAPPPMLVQRVQELTGHVRLVAPHAAHVTRKQICSQRKVPSTNAHGSSTFRPTMRFLSRSRAM